LFFSVPRLQLLPEEAAYFAEIAGLFSLFTEICGDERSIDFEWENKEGVPDAGSDDRNEERIARI